MNEVPLCLVDTFQNADAIAEGFWGGIVMQSKIRQSNRRAVKSGIQEIRNTQPLRITIGP